MNQPSDKSVLRIESTTEQKAAMFEWLREKALTGLKGNHLAAIAMQELNDYAELRRSNILIGEETIARLRAGEIVRFDSLPITIAMVQDELGSAPSSTRRTDLSPVAWAVVDKKTRRILKLYMTHGDASWGVAECKGSAELAPLYGEQAVFSPPSAIKSPVGTSEADAVARLQGCSTIAEAKAVIDAFDWAVGCARVAANLSDVPERGTK